MAIATCTKCGDEPVAVKSHSSWGRNCLNASRKALYDARKGTPRDPCVKCKNARTNNDPYQCSVCISARAKASVLKNKYGITVCQFAKLRIEANDRCQICDEPQTSKLGAVDHDHQTGEARGYLCFDCNSAIGKLGDTVKGVQRALDYLLKFEGMN